MAILLPEDLPRYEDPVAALIKRRRRELGLSLEELAKRSGIQSRSYIHGIENGQKVPSEEKAVRIARALGEDEETFRAWARVRGGGKMDWHEAARSVERLAGEAIANIRRDPRHEVMRAWLQKRPALRVAETPIVGYGEQAAIGAPERRLAQVLIPLIREGADPGDGPSPLNVEGRIQLDPGLAADTSLLLDRLKRLKHPFAWSLTVTNTRRCRDLLPPGFYAVATRDVIPIEPHEAYVIRTKHGIELGYLRWDGRRLLLMPTEDESDFEVWDMPGPDSMREIVVGKIALLLPPEIAHTSR